MLFAIDWDGTINKNYAFFGRFIRKLVEEGHEYIIATGRKEADPVDTQLISLYKFFPALDIIYCDDEYKRTKVEKLGYTVDIWIDNEPGTIEPGKKLQW